MKHLTSEDWANYLYEELPPEEKQRCQSHLKDCDQCRVELEKWQAIQQQLNRWQLPLPTRPTSIYSSSVRWAIAAIALIGISFLFGYLSAPRPPSTESMIAALRSEFQSDLLRVKKELAQSANHSRSESLRGVEALREDVEKLLFNHTREIETALLGVQNESSANIKKIQMELETVAIVAEGRYQLSQNQLSSMGFSALPSSPHFSTQPVNY